MGVRFSGARLAALAAAFVIAPGFSALAQFSPPGFGGMGQTTGPSATTKTPTVKSSKSNTSDRMGGGGGGKAGGAAANRMGGGGGKGGANKAINLNSSRSN
ncbi:MAG: hypothetical protein WCE79_19595 [Xanthobacteraceae bacterium]